LNEHIPVVEAFEAETGVKPDCFFEALSKRLLKSHASGGDGDGIPKQSLFDDVQ
jgi:hypothetical protein